MHLNSNLLFYFSNYVLQHIVSTQLFDYFYLRQNVSSETNEGALVQNMTVGVASDDPSQIRTPGPS